MTFRSWDFGLLFYDNNFSICKTILFLLNFYLLDHNYLSGSGDDLCMCYVQIFALEMDNRVL